MRPCASLHEGHRFLVLNGEGMAHLQAARAGRKGCERAIFSAVRCANQYKTTPTFPPPPSHLSCLLPNVVLTLALLILKTGGSKCLMVLKTLCHSVTGAHFHPPCHALCCASATKTGESKCLMVLKNLSRAHPYLVGMSSAQRCTHSCAASAAAGRSKYLMALKNLFNSLAGAHSDPPCDAPLLR